MGQCKVEAGQVWRKNGFWFAVHFISNGQVFFVRGRDDEPPIDESDLNALIEHRRASRIDLSAWYSSMEGATIEEASEHSLASAIANQFSPSPIDRETNNG